MPKRGREEQTHGECVGLETDRVAQVGDGVRQAPFVEQHARDLHLVGGHPGRQADRRLEFFQRPLGLARLSVRPPELRVEPRPVRFQAHRLAEVADRSLPDADPCVREPEVVVGAHVAGRGRHGREQRPDRASSPPGR